MLELYINPFHSFLEAEKMLLFGKLTSGSPEFCLDCKEVIQPRTRAVLEIVETGQGKRSGLLHENCWKMREGEHV